MAKEYSHTVKDGRVVVVGTELPRHLRGYDADSDHQFTESPLKRLLSRKRK
jgi:hypothetical protein